MTRVKTTFEVVSERLSVNDLGGRFLMACPICFRVEENATTDGARAAVVVLIAVTAVVLGAFARFIVRFAKKDGGQ